MNDIRSLEPASLVFQSLHKGGPMNDGNIRNRHLNPAALKLGIDPTNVNRQAFRRSNITNLRQWSQGEGHPGAGTVFTPLYAMEIYGPEGQRRAVQKMMSSMEEQGQQREKKIT